LCNQRCGRVLKSKLENNKYASNSFSRILTAFCKYEKPNIDSLFGDERRIALITMCHKIQKRMFNFEVEYYVCESPDLPFIPIFG